MKTTKITASALAIAAFSATAIAACTHNPPPPSGNGKPCVVYGVKIDNCPPDLISRLPSPSSTPVNPTP